MLGHDSGRSDDDDSGPAGRIDLLYPGSASHFLSITFDAGLLVAFINRSRRRGLAGAPVGGDDGGGVGEPQPDVQLGAIVQLCCGH